MNRFSIKISLVGCIITCAMMLSCKKYTDEPGKYDPRLARKYCNDPEAVNFNRDFPGTADNSVCYYPADVFAGNYTFIDSVYDGSNKLQRQIPFSLKFSALNKINFSVLGFCTTGGGTVNFTGNRALRATVDTTVLAGQLLCTLKDTVSGYVALSQTDTTALNFYLTVVSDTGTTFHQGTAYRQ